MENNPQSDELRKRINRTALILGVIVLFVLMTAVPFWLGIMRIVGNQS